MPSVLTEAYFQDEGAAFDRLERIVWPNGPVCPKCGCTGRIGSLKGVKDKKGRESIDIKSAKLSEDGRTVTLKIEDLKLANNQSLKWDIKAKDGTAVAQEIQQTIHEIPPDKALN